MMMMTSKADTPINAENGGVITKKDLVRMSGDHYQWNSHGIMKDRCIWDLNS